MWNEPKFSPKISIFRHKIRHPTTGYEGPEGEQRYIDTAIHLTAIGLAPGGGITRHIYNQTIPNLQREKNFDSDPGIRLTTEGKARKIPQLG
jgi:hypothetical protein